MLPSDLLALEGKKKRIVFPNSVSRKENIIDIGPQTTKELEEKIKKAKIIVADKSPKKKYFSIIFDCI